VISPFLSYLPSRYLFPPFPYCNRPNFDQGPLLSSKKSPPFFLQHQPSTLDLAVLEDWYLSIEVGNSNLLELEVKVEIFVLPLRSSRKNHY